jgi:FAD/FMN-containing dehydrogenase
MKHAPTDMTVTVDAAMTLVALQTELAKAGQWLPLDPPKPATLREILDRNESGPRRFGYGTIREYVIGLKVELADGRLVKSGGQVVKNVAGYDLQKLFIGSGGTLGIAREVTFKLRPSPETERFVRQPTTSFDSADSIIEAILSSELTPVVFDLYCDDSGMFVVLGFDGTKDEVDWQSALAATLGFREPANLEYDKAFRTGSSERHKLSVLPSKLIDTLRVLGDASFVARAGNGIIFHRASVPAQKSSVPTHLLRRVKDAFDPKHQLPELPP